MLQLNKIASLSLLTLASAVASATARAQSITGGSASADPAAMGDGGLARYWWIVLIILIAAAALWYFLRRGNRSV